MPLIYRSMQADGDRPMVGRPKSMLGVKAGSDEHADINPADSGDVHPGSGGMSVAPAWRELPLHRIPRRLRGLCSKARGSNNTQIWRMG